jgi:hypothetical protein
LPSSDVMQGNDVTARGRQARNLVGGQRPPAKRPPVRECQLRALESMYRISFGRNLRTNFLRGQIHALKFDLLWLLLLLNQ